MDFYFIIVLMTNNCSIIKDLKAVISVLNADIFSSREITLSSSIIFVSSGSNFSLVFTDGVSQFTGSETDLNFCF